MSAAGALKLLETTIDEIHHAYKAGQHTTRQLVQMYVDRIEVYDKTGPTIDAIITLNAKALEEADRVDAAFKASGFVGPLHGIPVVVKDQADVVGMPTTLGSVLFKHYYFLVFVPSVVMPAGFTRDNLPAEITFLGRPYDDGNMIKLAYAYQQAPHHRRPPASTQA
jgi:Asp-tRNA(Asn)/Glu-tRNA(Gln) amidotransferase A subunit family amidase